MSEESLFLAALEKDAPAEREAFLNEACGTDRALRARVQLLLDADARARGILDRPVPGGLEQTGIYAPGEQAGAVIAGRYKLLEAIGEGGMGTVWVAEQTEPVRRKVALKLVKAGMDSRSVLARFEAERQALAVMDHPNIAKVLDGGLTETGRPFFVMEYVKGVPITEYCDAARLSIAERLNLFMQVCQAVQHAHHKGIIHRDLKPSNILVAPYDDRPIPKVIDFGLAKAMHQSLTERTLHTAHEMVLGTPLYMSPEQAQLNNLDVDTRSDIYSLGVLLYELLTGTTPLEKQRFKQAAWDEVKRIIREEDPPRPSLRLSTANTLPSLAAGRQIEPARLTRLVRGELDWIVMKSLEKDRSRRYETANGFAMDIQRYLSGEPVLAAPPSTRYRLQKFVRKNRASLTTAASIVTLLVAGAAFSSWQAVRATRAEAAARAAAKEAEDKAAETAAVLDFVENKIIAAARPDGLQGGLGRDVKVRDALDAALPFVELNFKDRPLIEARLRTTLGQSYRYLGDRKIALEQLERANAINQQYRPDAYETLVGMSLICEVYQHLGRGEEGLKLSEETVARMQAKLGPDHRDTLRATSTLAKQYYTLRRGEDARRLHQETLERQAAVLGPDDDDTLVTLMDLGTDLDLLRRYDEALQTRQEALTRMNAKYGEGHPQTLVAMGNVGHAYSNMGRRDEALKLREKCLAFTREKLPPDHPFTVAAMRNLAASYEVANRQADALDLREQALALEQANLGKDDASPLRHAAVLAEKYAAANQHAKAVSLAEETVELLKAKLGPDDPSTLWSMGRLAGIYLRAGRLNDAQMLSATVAQMQKKKLGADDPATLQSLKNLAAAYQAAGKTDQAVSVYEEILDLTRAKRGPDHPETLDSLNRFAWCYFVAKKWDLAAPLYETLRTLMTAKHGPHHRETLSATANLASCYKFAGKLELAIPLREDTLRRRTEQLGRDHPDTLRSLHELGAAYWSAGKIDLALPLYDELVKLRIAKSGSLDPDSFSAISGAEDFYQKTGNYLKAVSLFEQIWETRNPELPEGHKTRIDTQNHLGLNLFLAGRIEDAERHLLASYEASKTATGIPREWSVVYVVRLIGLYAEWDKPDEVAKWQAELQKFGDEAESWLSGTGRLMLKASRFRAAERLLRDCLAIREKLWPDDWQTFETKSLLGGALLGQNNTTDAEPLLLTGYEGMKQRSEKIPPSSQSRLTDAVARLVQLYETLGDQDKAAKWRNESEARRSSHE